MKTGPFIVAVVFCWFMGVTAISVGLGAAFPAINQVARPFVCPDGTMQQESRVFRPYPGKTVTSQTWYCIGEGGQSKSQLSMFPIAIISGSIYGGILFCLLFILKLRRKKMAG
ncbi:MAG: hypothetical protein K1X75_13205 [Leptospirales bacterium]|nr:hypothetical protein [Leptospirales bacterium]